MFDTVYMRTSRKPPGESLYSRCWGAAGRRDLPALLELAADPSLTTDMLATIAPSYHDHDSDIGLVNRVLDHPACVAAIAGRYATHRDAGIRRRVVTFPGLIGSTLHILTYDTDEQVRTAATALLESRDPSVR